MDNSGYIINNVIGLQVKYQLFLLVLIKIEFPPHVFEKPSHTKFHKKSIQWEPSVCMSIDRKADGQT